jgi:hypothetical protein
MATRSVVFLAYTEHFLVGSLVFGQSLAATPCSKPTIQHMTTNGGFGARAATRVAAKLCPLFFTCTEHFLSNSVDFRLVQSVFQPVQLIFG